MMLRFTVMSGPQDGHEVTVAGPAALVGRTPEADVALPHDRALPEDGVRIALRDGVLNLTSGSEQRCVVPGELFLAGGTWLRVYLDPV